MESIEIDHGTVDLGTVILERGRTAGFLVLDDLGEPVAGARIHLEPAFLATTGKTGGAEIEHAPGAAWAGRVEAAGHVGMAFDEAPSAGDRPVTLRMTRAFTVDGRFLDPDGIPVADGSVRIETGDRSRDEPLTASGGLAVDLPPHTPAVLVLTSPRTAELRVSVAGGAPGGSLDLGDLRASRGLVVEGRVTAATDGAAVAGARVWALRFASGRSLLSWIHSDFLEARTGVDGRFRLAGLAPQQVELRIDAAGFARRAVALEPPPGAFTVEAGDIELSEGATVHVVAESVETGRIARVDPGNAWLEPDMLTAPLVEGLAVVKNVPPGKSTVSIVHGDRILCAHQVTVPPGPDLLEVNCREAGMKVRGLVEVGGRPAGPGLLSWRPAGPRDHGVILTYGSSSGVSQQQVLWGGEPSQRVAVDGGGYFESEGLRPGSWEVVFSSASGGAGEPRRVDLPETADLELTLSFPGTAVRGSVSSTEGEPIRGARVQDLGRRVFAISGSDGSFSLSADGAGSLELQARLAELSSDVARIELGGPDPPPPVHLVLKDRTDDRIVLRVLGPDERPIPGALVFLEEESKGTRLLTADASGEVRATIHPPLPPRVRAAAVAEGRWQFGDWTRPDAARDGWSLVLEEVGSLVLSSARDEETVEIVSPNGWDLSWLRTRLGLRPMVSEGRALTLEGLPAGLYEILAGESRLSVTVERGGVARARID